MEKGSKGWHITQATKKATDGRWKAHLEMPLVHGKMLGGHLDDSVYTYVYVACLYQQWNKIHKIYMFWNPISINPKCALISM